MQEIEGFINLIEVPAHFGITPTLPDLQALLEAPIDLPLTQWQLAPLHRLSKRLTGCTWQVVGCVVPVTDQPPASPFIQYASPPIRLQAWLWRTSQHPRQLYGDLRWHPAKGRSFVIAGPGSTDEHALLRIWRWLKSSEARAVGRPAELAYAISREAFEQRLITVIQAIERGPMSRVATRQRVADHFPMSVRTLYNYLQWHELKFDGVRARARHQEA